MHPYIPYLLEDIEKAIRIKEENIRQPQTFEEEMEEIERYVSGENEKSLQYYTNLDKEHFPPSNQLSEEDMKIVLDAFLKMLLSHNISVDYPSEMPVKERYDFLINKILNEKVTIVNSGLIHLDFCTGYAPGCDWGIYCPCKEFWDEEN